MLSFRSTASPSRDWSDYLVERATRARDPRLQRFFSAGCPSSQAPIGEAPLVALDMETTGLDPDRHAIVSIGLIPFTLQRIAPGSGRYWVVRPPRSLTERSIAFHHITHSEIANAPDLSEILDELVDHLAGRIAVVHYRNIERTFLNTAVKARLGESMRFPMIDTMALEARHYRWSYRARLRHWLGLKPVSIRLNDSRNRYGLPAYSSHHAMTDALATAELLQAQVAHHYSPETPVGTLWS